MSLAPAPSSAIPKRIGKQFGNMHKMENLIRSPQRLRSDTTLRLRGLRKITPKFLMLKTQLEASGFMVDLDAARVRRPEKITQTTILRWLTNGGMDTKERSSSSSMT